MKKKQTYPILKTLSVSDCKGELIANNRNCCPTRTWTGSAMQKHLYMSRDLLVSSLNLPVLKVFGISRSLVLVFKSCSWDWDVFKMPQYSMLLSWHEEVPLCLKEKLHVWLKKFLYELLSSLLCDQSDNQVADTQKRFDHYKLLQYPEREHLLPCPCDPRSRKTPGWAPTRRSPVRAPAAWQVSWRRRVKCAQKVILGLSTVVLSRHVQTAWHTSHICQCHMSDTPNASKAARIGRNGHSGEVSPLLAAITEGHLQLAILDCKHHQNNVGLGKSQVAWFKHYM